MLTRVRFAPSPTGHVHIGNIRVAIFNWLFARHEGGKFLLRIEDTDRERSTGDAIMTLLNAMQWLGLDYDEEAYYQSKNLERHKECVEAFIAKGHASCKGDGEPTLLHLHEGLFDDSFVTEPRDDVEIDVSKGELFSTCRSLLRKVVSSKGETYVTPINWDAMFDLQLVLNDGSTIPGDELRTKTDIMCDGFEICELQAEQVLGQKVTTLRFKRRYVFFEDLVLGRMEKPLDSLRDIVIVRSDGSPVFHLANVEDDVVMGITHILRGNDHVENTYRHLFIFKALESAPPKYAHFPMIVNQKGKPYSKRDGDAYVGDFRDRGILPDALFNFLALCGWSPGDDREIMSREDMIKAFSLDRVNDAPSQFNHEKLEWMNAAYLTEMPVADLLPLIREELQSESIDIGDIDKTWLSNLVDLERERLKSVKEFVQNTHFFWVYEVEYDPKAVKKNLLKKDRAGLIALKEMRPVLGGIEPWDVATLDKTMGEFAGEKEYGMGMIAQPIRTAITGTGVSRGIWETLALLGKECTLARIDRCISTVDAMD